MSITTQTSASQRIASLLDDSSFVEIGTPISIYKMSRHLPMALLQVTVLLTEILYMYTVKMHQYLAAQLVKCMQKRLSDYMIWL